MLYAKLTVICEMMLQINDGSSDEQRSNSSSFGPRAFEAALAPFHVEHEDDERDGSERYDQGDSPGSRS